MGILDKINVTIKDINAKNRNLKMETMKMRGIYKE